jgi:hypothetical protein
MHDLLSVCPRALISAPSFNRMLFQLINYIPKHALKNFIYVTLMSHVNILNISKLLSNKNRARSDLMRFKLLFTVSFKLNSFWRSAFPCSTSTTVWCSQSIWNFTGNVQWLSWTHYTIYFQFYVILSKEVQSISEHPD